MPAEITRNPGFAYLPIEKKFVLIVLSFRPECPHSQFLLAARPETSAIAYR